MLHRNTSSGKIYSFLGQAGIDMILLNVDEPVLPRNITDTQESDFKWEDLKINVPCTQVKNG